MEERKFDSRNLFTHDVVNLDAIKRVQGRCMNHFVSRVTVRTIVRVADYKRALFRFWEKLARLTENHAHVLPSDWHRSSVIQMAAVNKQSSMNELNGISRNGRNACTRTTLTGMRRVGDNACHANLQKYSMLSAFQFLWCVCTNERIAAYESIFPRQE